VSRSRSILTAAAAALFLTGCQDMPLAPDHAPAPDIPVAPPSGELRTGWIFNPDGEPVEVTFVVFEGWAIFEGDINLGRADEIATTREELLRTTDGPRFGVYINGSQYRWPSGTVPYVIDASFSWWQQQTIVDAMNHVASKVGGVRFVQRTNQTAYVVFAFHSSVCNSFVGRQGNAQTVNLTSGCAGHMGIVAHEILHALGMWHEQSRCDRDDFVNIHLNNVIPGEEHNFSKKCSGSTTVFSYNEGSIMHYGTHYFSVNNQPTITSKRGLDGLMGQRSGLAQSDASTINWIYQPYAPQNVTVTNSGGYTAVNWSPSPGATHYTFTQVTIREYRDWTGAYWSTEYRGGTSIITGTSAGGDLYTGQTRCVLFENMYEVDEENYYYEIRAHFPDGISGAAGWSWAPIGDC
jgi:hypothetical protein